MSEEVLIDLAALVILGIGAQWLAWRLRFPSIIFLLIFGFLAGPVTGLLNPDQLMGEMLLPFVTLAVAVILFEGGLTLNIKELREIGPTLLSLISIGAFITWGVGATGAYFILGLNLQISILLGAILVVTGPTVIGPLLRHIRPTGKVNDILKWEGIVIDPIGALLAVLVFEAILVGEIQNATAMVLMSLGKTILFGGLIGLAFAWLLLFLLRKYWVPDFLQETVTLSLVIAAYLLSDLLQPESGLFSATLMGIIMANQRYVSVKHILEFKENLRILIISVLFIILSARLDPSSLDYVSVESGIFLLLLIIVARPLSVFFSTLGKKINLKEKLFLSWIAPRGIVAAAVSSIFALRLSETGMEGAEALVPVTFIVIVGTVAIYGLTSSPVARRLGIAESDAQGLLIVGAHSWALEIARVIKSEGYKVVMVDTNKSDVNKAKMAGITSYYGSIMSEYVVENIALGGIGKVLALTSNDEINSLTMLRFGEVYDRQELYQLAPFKANKGKEHDYSPKHLQGRFLFGKGISFNKLRSYYYAGAVIKSTKLTKEFTFDAFRKLYGEDAIPLFFINENKDLLVPTNENTLKPKPGYTIIAMVQEASKKA